MSSLVNDRVLAAIGKATEETNCLEGLEAILLVLHKLRDAMGLLTDQASYSATECRILQKIEGAKNAQQATD